MRTTVLACVVFAMVMTGATTASAAFVNGGFETGDATGWTPSTQYNKDNYSTWGMFVQDDVVHSGDYAYLIHHDAQANTLGRSVWQNVDLSGGDHLSFWLNVDLNPNGVAGDAGSFAGVDIRQAGYGAVITNLVTMGSFTPGHYGTDGWQLYEFDLSSYALPDQVAVSFWLSTYNNDSRANQRIYIDDVAVTGAVPVPVPSALLLAGIGISGLAGLRRSRKML